MSQQEDDAKMIEEMERLEREATGGPWRQGMPACDCLPMTADLESSVMFPNGECIVDHASDANAAFVKESRNNLPRLLALAKIGVLAIEGYDSGGFDRAWERNDQEDQWARRAVSAIDAYKEKHK